MLGLEDGPIAELVKFDNEDPTPDAVTDDDEEALPLEENAVVGVVTLPSRRPVVEDALVLADVLVEFVTPGTEVTPENVLVLDGVLVAFENVGKTGVFVDAIGVEVFEAKGFAIVRKGVVMKLAELADKVGIKLLLPSVEVELVYEALEGTKLERLVLGLATALVEKKLGVDELIFWPVTTLVVNDSELDEPTLGLIMSLVEETAELGELAIWLDTTLVEGDSGLDEPMLWLAGKPVEAGRPLLRRLEDGL